MTSEKDQPDARRLVTELEYEERAAIAADAANRTIRLHRGPYGVAAEVGHEESAPVPGNWWMKLWTGNTGDRKVSHLLSDAEITAVAEALLVVRDDHRRRAYELARHLNTKARI